MFLYEDEKEIIKRVYGTKNIGSCRNCVKSKEYCGGCTIPCFIEMHRLNKRTDSASKALKNRIAKYRFMGALEEITQHWVYYTLNGLVYWVNPFNSTYSPKGYKSIRSVSTLIHGSHYLVCEYGSINSGNTCYDIYSRRMGGRILNAGLPEVGITGDTWMRMSYADKWGIIVGNTVDPGTNLRFNLAFGMRGDRIAFNYCNIVQCDLDANNDNNIVSLLDLGVRFVVDERLNLIDAPRGFLVQRV